MENDSIKKLRIALSEMLPSDIAFHIEEIANCPDSLYPEERAQIEKAVEKRRREFAAGRYCARNCLETFNLADTAIVNAESRAPIWPEKIIGSISHSNKVAGAVVSEKSLYLGVGLDIEETDRIKSDMHDQLYTSSELDLIGNEKLTQDHCETIIFSAKEAFFKLQYPITNEWLEFKDVEVTLDPENSIFQLKVLKPQFDSALINISGKYHTQADLIMTVIYKSSANL